MRKIKVVVLLVRQLQQGFTKNAKVSPNLTGAQVSTIHRFVFSETMIHMFTTCSVHSLKLPIDWQINLLIYIIDR